MLPDRSLFIVVPLNISFFLLCTINGYAQQQAEPDLEQILQGFEKQSIPDLFSEPDQQIAEQSYPHIDFSSIFSTHFSYSPFQHTTPAGYSINGLTSLQPRFFLDVDISFSERWFGKISGWAYHDFVYSIRGREHYSKEVIENYEQKVELGETYLRGNILPGMDVSFGRQLEVWGKSDFFRVLDIINPIDNREPGLTDIKVKRLPLLMTKVDSYFDSWHVSALVTHEFRYNYEPVFGNDFYPYAFPAPPRENVDNDIENSSFGFTAGRSYPGLDIDFYAGSLLQELNLEGLNTDIPQRRVSRISLLGMAAEKVMQHWLFKMEVAWIDGLEYYALPDQKKSRFDLLVGIDYTGLEDTRLSLEIVNRYIFGLDSEMIEEDELPAGDTLIWAVRVAKSFQRDKLEIAFYSYVGGVTFSHGSAQEISAKLKSSDNLSFTIGYLFVQEGDNFFMKTVGDNDRVFFRFKYTF